MATASRTHEASLGQVGLRGAPWVGSDSASPTTNRMICFTVRMCAATPA